MRLVGGDAVSRPLVRLLVAVLAAGVAIVLPSVDAGASTSADDPPEFLSAGEAGATPEATEYWIGRVPCPEITGAVLERTGSVSLDTVQLVCSYEVDQRLLGSYAIKWSKPGAAAEFLCGLESADLGWQQQLAAPDLDAQIQVQFERADAELADEIAAGGRTLFEYVGARAAPCAPYGGPVCPPVDGWVRSMFFGPGDRMETREGDASQYSCTYDLPAASYADTIEQSFDVTVFREGDFVTADDVLIACSAGSWFAYGQGGVGTEGRYAATADYQINSADPIDTAPLLGAIDVVIDEFGPTGSSCEGLELLPSDPYSPIPLWLADVFTADAITAGRPPIIGQVARSGDASAPTAGVDAGSDAGAATTDDATNDETAISSDEDAEPADDRIAVGLADTGGSGPAWLWRTISVVGLVLTVLSLAVTFLLIRREVRVRPKLDVVRIVIMLVVAAAMLFVFSKGAPLWAVAVALVLGAGLGYWQGANLVVRLTERGVFAQRNTWAVGAFAVGIVVSQVAGLLNRTGVIAVGIALTFFSAAIAVGLLAGRAPRVNAAKAATLGTLSVLLVAMLMAAGPAPRSASAGAEPDEQRVPDGIGPRQDTVAPENRTDVMEALVDMVPWETIQLHGGASCAGKPPLEIAVPRALDTPPDAVTRSITCPVSSSQVAFDLTETFSFGMRPDGFCCTVDYEVAGTRTKSDGESAPYQASGRLDDIQIVGVEGGGDLAPYNSLLVGLPFLEIDEYDVFDGVTETTGCRRAVAVPRSFDALSATGGGAQLEVDDPKRNDWVGLQIAPVQLGAPCDLPDFSVENALALAPDPPPLDDPARQYSNQAAGCPVRQELVGALAAGAAFEGVHTATVGELFLDPNSQVCSYGNLLDPPAVGQGGRGKTRYEFGIEFAKPRRGEWDRGYSSWYPDPCCIALPSKMVPENPELAASNRPQAPTVCAVDDRGVPVAPADRAEGGTCSLVTQHRIPGVEGAQVWISTEYVPDGPNTTVRVELPWGAFRARCHHCEPGDPRITDFIESMIAFGNDAAAGIGPVGAVGAGTETDMGEIGEEPGSRQEAAERAEAEAAEAAARDEAEDLVDLLVPEGAGDEEREAALAAVIALLGAAGVGAASLGEAGVNAREVWDAWRGSGRDGVDDLLRERNTPDPMEGAVVDERGEVLVPGDDGLYEWDDGDTVRRVPRDELDELIARERSADAARRARHDSIVADHESDAAAEQRLDDLSDRSREQDRVAREQLREDLDRAAREDLTRQRVAEQLAERAAAGGWDAIADRLEQGDALSVEELQELRDIVDWLTQQQGAVDPETTGTYAQDLWDEFASDAAVAQEVLARVAEHSPFGPAGGWIVRNPAAAGRIAAALATGGLTEGILTPWEIAQAMERAAAQAHAEGRDLTYGEALAAGMWQAAPGMVIGKVGQVGLDRFGRVIAETTEEGIEAALRQIDEFFGAGTRSGARAGVGEGAESAARTAAGAAPPPRLSPQELSELRTRVADAIESGDDEALRAVYQNGGMQRLGELEAAGAMDQRTATALVDFHDRLTGGAIRQGTHDTIDEFARLHDGVKPTEVLVANSGSVGAGRSVVTDADRTISTSFSRTDIENWAARRGISEADAAVEMRTAFAELHEVNVGRNLNPPGTRNVVTPDDMDVSSYSGFGGNTSHVDKYPVGYTQSRMATQGNTEVYRVMPDTGEVRVHSTSGQAVIDHNMLEQARFPDGKNLAPEGADLVIPRGADGWPTDPTRIPNSELPKLLDEQRKAVTKYTDVKSVAKAIDRAEYIASRSGQPMSDPALVEASVRMRADPRQTADVLRELGMTEAEYVAACKEMMDGYRPGLT